MVKNIDHIAIAVNDLAVAAPIFEAILGTAIYKKEMIASEGVCTHFLQIGETKIELLESINESGTIAKFLQKKGQGMHHIALEVDDIYQEMKRLQAQGFELLNDVPKIGADQKLICFLHPNTTAGVLVELVQTPL
ncbi:MAG: methylmalonyl-CoA epimerase [Bacteroidota bacterium]